MPNRRQQRAKIALVLVWLVLFVGVYVWFDHTNLPIKHLPRALRDLVQTQGLLGPIIILLLYAVRTFLFIPTTPLILIAASLYGTWLGILLTMVGDNLSSTIGFFTGRFLGRDFVSESERGWLKKYDRALSNDGFLAVLLMRLLYFPFDLVNLGCGMSGIPFRQYAVATFIGLIPAIITLSVLGDAFVNPKAYILFFVLFVVTIIGALLLRNSRWAKRRLYPNNET